MRSELTPIINHVNEVITYVRENLDEEEYDLFLDLIVPEPERVVEKSKPKKPKKILHCDACNYTKRHQVHKDSSRSDYHEFQSAKGATKSARAKSLQQQIQTQAPRPLDGGVSKMRCARGNCGEYMDNSVHHRTTDPDYHEFVESDSGKSHALAAGEGL